MKRFGKVEIYVPADKAEWFAALRAEVEASGQKISKYILDLVEKHDRRRRKAKRNAK